MIDLRGATSLSRAANTSDALERGEEPQHCSTIPHLSPLLRNTGEKSEIKGISAFAILKGEY